MLKLSDRLIITISICAGLLVAIASFLLAFGVLRAVVPDCAPGTIDGQCGLASFVDMIVAFLFSVGIWPASSALIAWYWLRKKENSLAPLDDYD